VKIAGYAFQRCSLQPLPLHSGVAWGSVYAGHPATFQNMEKYPYDIFGYK